MRTTAIDGRECTRCGELKPWSEFPKMRQSSTGYRPDCKPCHVEASMKQRNKRRSVDPEAWDRQRSEAMLKNRHGLTPDQYDAMLEEQDGGCAICGAKDSRINRKSIRPLVVDHDHETGKVRGLLCDPCNNGLARFDDDPDRMVAAASYLIQREV